MTLKFSSLNVARDFGTKSNVICGILPEECENVRILSPKMPGIKSDCKVTCIGELFSLQLC